MANVTRAQIWAVLDENRAGVAELAKYLRRDERRLRRVVARSLPGADPVPVQVGQLRDARAWMIFNRWPPERRAQFKTLPLELYKLRLPL